MTDSNDPQVSGASRYVRPIVAVLAALGVAFCGWSAWAYAQGADPLAFLSAEAFQTTTGEPESAPQLTMTSNVEPATTTKTVTADDVERAIDALAFDGEDVSVPEDDFVAVIVDDGVWVEQTTTDAAPQMVDATARRAAALAAWAGEQNVGLAHVTWIAEDANGTARMAVRFAADEAPASGDAAALLVDAACEGYAISGDAYAELGEAPAFAQSAGEAPALPDATPVAVEARRTSSGENLSASDAAKRKEDVKSGKASAAKDGSASSGSSSGGSNGGSGSGSGASGGSGSSSSSAGAGASSRPAAITVSITVDGSAAGAGSSSATLSLDAGATVYDALAASGVGFNSSMTGYGMYVSSIGGLAEKDHGGMSGWVYAVNGVEPSTACSNYVLSDGDSIYWSYVNVEY